MILRAGRCLPRGVLPAALTASLVPIAAGADQTVQVGPGNFFSPQTVTVAPGEAVHWEFQALHTSTSDSQSGAEIWDSGMLSSGTFSHTFTVPGTHPYYCAIHSFPGGTMMNGVVEVVGAGVTPTPTETPVSIASPTATPTSPGARTMTATPVSGAAPAGVPDLDVGGRIVLVLALAVAGIAALLVIERR